MQPKFTIQERLKDLRVVDFDLTRKMNWQSAPALSRSALGKYESDETAKDISPFADPNSRQVLWRVHRLSAGSDRK